MGSTAARAVEEKLRALRQNPVAKAELERQVEDYKEQGKGSHCRRMACFPSVRWQRGEQSWKHCAAPPTNTKSRPLTPALSATAQVGIASLCKVGSYRSLPWVQTALCLSPTDKLLLYACAALRTAVRSRLQCGFKKSSSLTTLRFLTSSSFLGISDLQMILNNTAELGKMREIVKANASQVMAQSTPAAQAARRNELAGQDRARMARYTVTQGEMSLKSCMSTCCA